jgi:ABC-type Fe3+-hydroxamate transport system substrate-binding protein
MKKKIIFILILSTGFVGAAPCNAGKTPGQGIITLSPHLAELVCLLDACDRLVGVVEHSNFPTEVKTIQRIGDSAGLDIEQILTIAPDLVLAWQDGSRQVDVDHLEALGLRVVSIRSSTIKDIPESIGMLGDLLGKQEKASEIADAFNARLSTIKSKYETLPVKRVFIEISSRPLMGLSNRHSFSSGLELCRLHNIFNDIDSPAFATNLEAVLERAPDYVILKESLGEDESAARMRFYHVPGAEGIRFIHSADDLAFRQTPRMLDAIENACQQVTVE